MSTLRELQVTQDVGFMVENIYQAKIDQLQGLRLVPSWPCPAQKGNFLEPEADTDVIPNLTRAPGMSAPEVDTGWQDGVNYFCEHVVARTPITAEDLHTASARYGINELEKKARYLVGKLLTSREAKAIAIYRALDVETWTYSGTLAAAYYDTEGTQITVVTDSANQWDAAASSPLNTIADAMVWFDTQPVSPNQIWIPYSVGRGLIKNTQWRTAFGTFRSLHELTGRVDEIHGLEVVWYDGKAKFSGTRANMMGEDVIITSGNNMVGSDFDGHAFEAVWLDGTDEIAPPKGVDVDPFQSTEVPNLQVWTYPDPDPSRRVTWVEASLGFRSDPTIAKVGGSLSAVLIRNVLTGGD